MTVSMHILLIMLSAHPYSKSDFSIATVQRHFTTLLHAGRIDFYVMALLKFKLYLFYNDFETSYNNLYKSSSLAPIFAFVWS